MDIEKLEKNIAEHRSFRSLPSARPLCSAPTVGLYFNADGRVGACCYNRTNIFGKYPEKTIQEIWNCVERSSMADLLEKNEFPEGCIRCQSEVYKSPHVRILAQRFDHLLSSTDRVNRSHSLMPLTAEFELGTICNLECVMCNGWVSSSIRKNREKLPALTSPYDDAFVDQLRPFIPRFVDVKFLGGEPFLNRLNFLVWDLFIELNRGANISITTNGTVLNDRVKRVVSELKPWLVISIESLDEKNYEWIRKNADFGKVRANIDWLTENGYLRALTACVMPSNWKDLPAMVSFCNLNGLQIHFNTVFEPHEHSMESLSTEELRNVHEFLISAEIQTSSKTDPDILNKNQEVYGSLVEQVKALSASRASK
jgi:MoaA/NifB/PqqE/SkfB family radical SAM enzyme